MVDKFDFMKVVQDVFEECKEQREIDSRMKEMVQIVEQQGILSKEYLKLGFLN